MFKGEQRWVTMLKCAPHGNADYLDLDGKGGVLVRKGRFEEFFCVDFGGNSVKFFVM